MLADGDPWQVKVMPAWRLPSGERSFGAYLEVKRAGEKRYKRVAPIVLNDESAAAAVADLVRHHGVV